MVHCLLSVCKLSISLCVLQIVPSCGNVRFNLIGRRILCNFTNCAGVFGHLPEALVWS